MSRLICKHFVLANKAKVYYGLMKEPDINIPLDDDDGDAEGEDKPKVGRSPRIAFCYDLVMCY